MDPIWLNAYPKQVSHCIDHSQYDSVLAIYKESVANYHDRPAYNNFSHTVTFEQLDQLTRQFACYLQYDLELGKGDRLAIMLPNLIQYPVAVFAAMRIGMTVINIDPMYTERELALQLNDSEADALICLESFADVVCQSLPNSNVKHVFVSKLGDCLPRTKRWFINAAFKYIKKAVPSYHIESAIDLHTALYRYTDTSKLVDADLTHKDIMFLQYTGGTTGLPKGVMLSHGNIVANIMQIDAWIAPFLSVAKEKAIAALPMYHIFCMTANIMLMMKLGCENILITNPRDFNGFVKILRKQKFTFFAGVNTLYRKLLDTPGFDEINFSHIRLSFAGGMAVTDDVAQQWLECTNSAIIEGYGLSETSPAVIMNPIHNKFTGSIGLPIPSTDIKLLDNNDNEVGINQPGELCIKGPQVTLGYWNKPQETKQAFTQDNYFRTGDYASIDETGYVTILDRKKDMVLVSGFNVFPNEIENVVNQHPDITESAVIGVDDDITGQAVKLFVVKANPNLTAGQVSDYCKQQLTGYKCPKEIMFLNDLPKSHVGKILRKNLV